MPLVGGLVLIIGEFLELCGLAGIYCDVIVLNPKILFLDIILSSNDIVSKSKFAVVFFQIMSQLPTKCVLLP